MRTLIPALAITLLTLTMANPLRAESRSERTYQNIDRSMQDQQRRTQTNQQNQFEFNQMRQGIDRNNLFTPAPDIQGPGLNRR